MKLPSNKPDPVLDPFEKWLKESCIVPRHAVLDAVRARLKEEPEDLDSVIDTLLQPNPGMRNPQMLARVRQHLDAGHEQEKVHHIHWFQWLTPLAAAAILTLAFISFQLKAPEGTIRTIASAPVPQVQSESGTTEESDLTMIFALATNLEGSTNVSRLQSVDDFAFLFE